MHVIIVNIIHMTINLIWLNLIEIINGIIHIPIIVTNWKDLKCFVFQKTSINWLMTRVINSIRTISACIDSWPRCFSCNASCFSLWFWNEYEKVFSFLLLLKSYLTYDGQQDLVLINHMKCFLQWLFQFRSHFPFLNSIEIVI